MVAFLLVAALAAVGVGFAVKKYKTLAAFEAAVKAEEATASADVKAFIAKVKAIL